VTPHEIPAARTALTIEGLWNGLILSWETMGVEPKRTAIELKLAHILLETGLKSCWNWNLGNLKSAKNDGYCWQFFDCDENVPVSRLTAIEALLPGHTFEKCRFIKDGVPTASVGFKAPHPWTKFAAFETLADGIAAQLKYLTTNQYAKKAHVLEALQTGDPEAYVRALRAASYFTADPMLYLRGTPQNKHDGLEGCLETVIRACREFNWGDVS
jgi:hypothetical protein